MVVAAVTVGALLLIVSVLQATFADKSWITHRRFRAIAVALAFISAALMVIAAVREDRAQKSEAAAQEDLQAAVRGLSKTVFPQDMSFTCDVIYESLEANPRLEQFFNIGIYIVPRESPFFGRWGVTHAPNPDLGLGALFTEVAELTGDESAELITRNDTQFLLFKSPAPAGMGTVPVPISASPPDLNTLRSPTYRSVDDYLASQFLCEIQAPGRIARIANAKLTLKGKPVPFNLLPTANSWTGVTVFNPTFQRFLGGTAWPPRR
jgi:hypothetical protein